MKDNGISFLIMILLVLTSAIGITYLDSRFSSYHDRRYNEVYKEGMAAGSAGMHYNMNPYDWHSSRNFYVEWRRGYNAGLIGESK